VPIPTLEKVVAQAGDISALPTVARKALEQIDSNEGSPAQVGETLSNDPVLAARILKVANSPLFGLSNEVTSLPTAVSLMGFRTTRDLVLLASLRAGYRRFGLPERLLWAHSVACGIGARMIARQYSPAVVEDAFICGLLHDVGKVVLLNEAAEPYTAVMMRTYNENLPFIAVEREVLGYTHTELGASVAERWRYPKIIQVAVRHHHADQEQLPPPADSSACATLDCVDLANVVCKIRGMGYRSPQPDLDLGARPAFARLELPEGSGPDLAEEINETFAKQAAGWV
jgi:putative nucleotidyltransferase with HDIG domain